MSRQATAVKGEVHATGATGARAAGESAAGGRADVVDLPGRNGRGNELGEEPLNVVGNRLAPSYRSASSHLAIRTSS